MYIGSRMVIKIMRDEKLCKKYPASVNQRAIAVTK